MVALAVQSLLQTGHGNAALRGRSSRSTSIAGSELGKHPQSAFVCNSAVQPRAGCSLRISQRRGGAYFCFAGGEIRNGELKCFAVRTANQLDVTEASDLRSCAVTAGCAPTCSAVEGII